MSTEIYTLSLHDALPILSGDGGLQPGPGDREGTERADDAAPPAAVHSDRSYNSSGTGFRPSARPIRNPPVLRLLLVRRLDRKSTRLNSSHSQISYAVLCL